METPHLVLIEVIVITFRQEALGFDLLLWACSAGQCTEGLEWQEGKCKGRADRVHEEGCC